MRRRVSLGALLVLLLGLIGGGVATAGAQHPKDPPPKSGAQELTLYARETSFTFVSATGEVVPDGEEPIPAPGDRFVLVDTLYADPERTEEVGRNLIECTLVSASGETEEEFTANALCRGVVVLDGQGDIAWQGQFQIRPGAEEEALIITVALTGGTGAFERAGGSAAIFDESPEEGEETLSRYEIRLFEFKVKRGH